MSDIFTESSEVMQDDPRLGAIDLDRLFTSGSAFAHDANQFTDWTGFALSDETLYASPSP